MKKEDHSPNDIPTKQSRFRSSDKANAKELSSFHKSDSKTPLKTTKIQLSLTNLNTEQPRLNTSNTSRKIRIPLSLKPKGAQTHRNSKVSNDSRGSFSQEKSDAFNKTSTTILRPKLNITKLEINSIKEDFHFKGSNTTSHKERSNEREELNVNFSSKLGIGVAAEKRPSFLAPTVAMLQHMKDITPRKDKNDRGFSFSRPKDAVTEYFADGAKASPRGSTFLNSSHQLNHSNAHENSPSLRKHVLQIAMYNSAKKGDGKDKIGPEDLKITGVSAIEKKRISNIMTKELMARWGNNISTSSATSDDDDDESSDDLTDKKSEVEIAIKVPKTQMERQKTIEAHKAQAAANKKEEESLSPLQKKPDPTSNKLFLKDIRRGAANFLLRGQDTPKSSVESEKDTNIRDPEADKKRKMNVFSDNASQFFKFNEDHRLYPTISDIYEKDESRLLASRTKSSTTTESVPIIIDLNNKNKIIQPTYMTNMGSMCVTEFWSKKNNDTFFREAGNNTKRITIRKPERENEMVYRPSNWTKQEIIREKLTTNPSESWGSYSLNMPTKTNKLSNPPHFVKAESLTSRSHYKSAKNVWHPPEASPRSTYGGFGTPLKAQTSRRTSHANKFSEFISAYKLDTEGEKARVSMENILAELEGVSPKPMSSYKKKLNDVVLAVGKSEQGTFTRYLQDGFIARKNEVKEIKKRVVKLDRLKDKEDSF